jgi:hypothetical protein
VAALALLQQPLRAADTATTTRDIVVRESHGVYSVVARFHVARPREVALAVLTDYDRNAEIKPGFDTSVVVERVTGHAVVDHDTKSGYKIFNKPVHLRL